MPREICAVVGAPGDGLLSLLGELGVPHVPWDRLDALDQFGSVIVVADGYPDVTRVEAGSLEAFLRAGGSAYVEYATGGFLPGMGEPRHAGFERIHTTAESSPITAGMAAGTLFDEHGSWALQALSRAGAVEVLSYGRVAGTHTLAFGPDPHSWPALLDVPVGAGRLLYATTALSNFARGRYKPAARWRTLMLRILADLTGAPVPAEVTVVTRPRVWAATGDPVVLEVRGAREAYLGGQPIAMHEGEDGAHRSEPLILADGVHEFVSGTATVTVTVGPREQRYRRMVDRGIAWYHRAGMLFGRTDGSAGVAEGLSNEVGPDGVWPLREVHRGDCYVQSAHAFRLYHELTGEEQAKAVCDNLMRLVLDRMQLTDRNALYGSWEPRGPRTELTFTNNLFADDNGWVSLFALAHGALEQGLRGTEALVRTAHADLGMQPDPWRTPTTLLVEGWEGLARRELRDGLDLSAHWNSSAQCAMLYAYACTGEPRYLDVACKGLDHMAASFPVMRLETSRTCEAIRFLLPLSAAYHYTRKPLYRETMHKIAGYLKALQDPATGAIPERDGRNPTSNAAYGVDEASIFQSNTDTLTDQLYATGYAALALPVAFRVTGDPVFGELAVGVLDYLSRIQIEDADPRLDGTWMRSFDFGHWDYYGSNCDVGWGPYSVETGWAHAPALIGAMLHLSGGMLFPETVTDRRAQASAVAQEFDDILTDAGPVRRRQGVAALVESLQAAGNPVWADNPPARSTEVYVRGEDGLLQHVYVHDRLGRGAWHPVGVLRVAGDPAVAFNPAADAVEVYALGTDGRVHHTTLVDPRAGHDDWEPVGALSFTGELAVSYEPHLGTVRVTARHADGRVYQTVKANRWHRPWVPADEPSTELLPWRVA